VLGARGLTAVVKGIVLYGASDLGRDVAAMGPALLDAWSGPTLHGFVDDRGALHGTRILDLPVLGGGDWLESEAAEGLGVVVTIGDPAVRERVAERLAAKGVRFATLIHPTAVVTPWVQIGEGTVVLARCTFTADIRIGRHVVFNPGCSIAHDVVVEDYVYVSPGVDLAGRVTLERSCYLGTGATVIPGRRVGARSVVGAGAVVIQDVPSDVTAAGVPARVTSNSGAS
jgi:sugar O-acyltransferase (sialic acid O-acetyltransferase NeuD family)